MLPLEWTTISLGLFSGLPLKRRMRETIRPASSCRDTWRPPCSQASKCPDRSKVRPLELRLGAT